MRRYEDLGVDRLVLVQDFGDMAGGPDAARRGKFLDEMTACAERLDIPEQGDDMATHDEMADRVRRRAHRR